MWLSSLRFIFKILFVFKGKDTWHKFELKYLDYLMTPLCVYAPWKYLDVINDTREFSSGLSWHVEEYLNSKNISWDGKI